ncbi:hypothetical protein J8273_4664 [Carpediemonas membranifera]|uniref:Uncharacterized protein n=1 Tax=Carpediemonas membranifera TaxID=201153 RepID=A0A8J6BXT1_9EUKA|nr:hypothetical protein J8273_4664 [Carpediemonas membranifera]|eukprot:KAG9393801.1 hypothetical protein J8273_4664 [Carpediemonas membranifera]
MANWSRAISVSCMNELMGRHRHNGSVHASLDHASHCTLRFTPSAHMEVAREAFDVIVDFDGYKTLCSDTSKFHVCLLALVGKLPIQIRHFGEAVHVLAQRGII